MNTLKTTLCTLCFLLTSLGSSLAQESLEEQIEDIMRIWPGTYNNSAEVAAVEKEGGDVWRIDDSGKDGYLHIQSHYIKLNAPEIGKNVLYVEEYRDLKPEETYRQRIYTINIDSAGQMIRVKMWPFKDKKKYIGAWKNLSLLDELTKEEISAYPDICDLLVQKTEEGYNMYMNGDDCTFGDKTFNYQVMLKEGVFSYRDKITSKSTGEIISTAANFAFHNLDRIEE